MNINIFNIRYLYMYIYIYIYIYIKRTCMAHLNSIRHKYGRLCSIWFQNYIMKYILNDKIFKNKFHILVFKLIDII